MNSKMKKIVLTGIKAGYNEASLAVNLCINRTTYGISEADYNDYCNWIKSHIDFWGWLQKRLNVFKEA